MANNIGRLNIGDVASQYGVSRRRGINEFLRGQSRRITKEMAAEIDRQRKEASKKHYGFDKNWGWLTSALSFIPGAGPALAFAATAANEAKKASQYKKHLKQFEGDYEVPEWAKGTFMENYATMAGEGARRGAQRYAKSASGLSGGLGALNLALSAVPLGKSLFPGTGWASKIVGKDAPLGKLGQKLFTGDKSLLGGILEAVTEIPDLAGTLTKPVFEEGLGKAGKWGAETTLAHLGQPLVNPFLDFLIQPQEEASIEALRAPQLSRRR
jgi:hypothetical protein